MVVSCPYLCAYKYLLEHLNAISEAPSVTICVDSLNDEVDVVRDGGCDALQKSCSLTTQHARVRGILTIVWGIGIASTFLLLQQKLDDFSPKENTLHRAPVCFGDVPRS